MMDAALIERLAKQSGLYISAELRIFAALIEAQMKERCAKECDDSADDDCEEAAAMARYLAAAIRAL